MSSEGATIKKEKKDKKDKSAKKRAREEEAGIENEGRKYKKSKSLVAQVEAADGELKADKKKKKKSKDVILESTEGIPAKAEDEEKAEKKDKKKKKKSVEANEEAEPSQDAATIEAKPKKKKEKKASKEEVTEVTTAEVPAAPSEPAPKKEKKSKKSEADKQQTELALRPQTAATPSSDAMEVDNTNPSKQPSKIHSPPDMPPNPQFPFFNQTISLYEPLYPSGWATPITGCESQHLRLLQNRYVPALRGVLLDYSNVSLSETPGRNGAATSDTEPAILTSRAEFGGGFGWITADVRLFVPSRGAWMEGSVNLQTEGHIGVVCFGKFNASVEARRLPPSWKWFPNEQAEFEETASVYTAPDEHGVVRQIHSTGNWVDGSGERIKGKIRFRIRNFDVGVSGDSTYLSLQGTMLDRAGEKNLVEAEAKEAKERKEKKGGFGRRKVPDFSMTRFGGEDEEEAKPQKAEVTEEVKVAEE